MGRGGNFYRSRNCPNLSPMWKRGDLTQLKTCDRRTPESPKVRENHRLVEKETCDILLRMVIVACSALEPFVQCRISLIWSARRRRNEFPIPAEPPRRFGYLAEFIWVAITLNIKRIAPLIPNSADLPVPCVLTAPISIKYYKRGGKLRYLGKSPLFGVGIAKGGCLVNSRICVQISRFAR